MSGEWAYQNGDWAAAQAASSNRSLATVSRIVQSVQELKAKLPADMVTAAKALEHLSAVTVEDDPLPAAIDEHAAAWLSAAANGKDAPTSELEKAAQQSAVRLAKSAALHKAKERGQQELIAATRANHEELIKAVRPAFDKAIGELKDVVGKIPATMTDLADITRAGLSQEWLRANAATEAIQHCHTVRSGLRTLGVKASTDQEDNWGWLRDGVDHHQYARSIDSLVDRYLAMTRRGAQFWLSTPGEHEGHIAELQRQQRERQAQNKPPVDPQVEHARTIWSEHRERLPKSQQ